MDTSVHPAGAVSVIVQRPGSHMKMLCVPPPSGKVRVFVNGTGSAGGSPSPFPVDTQSTTTGKLVPGVAVPGVARSPRWR